MSTQAASQQTPEPMERRSARVALMIIFGLLGVVLIGWLIVASVLGARLETAQADRDEAQRAVDEHVSVIEVAEDEQIEAATGASQSRMEDDEVIITPLVSTMGTWDSGASYSDARAEIIEDLGLSEDDPFVQDFMPPAAVNIDSEGNKYYYLDTVGVASEVSGQRIQLQKVEASVYTYTVLVDTAVSSEAVVSDTAGDETVDSQMMLEISIDGDGNVTDIKGAAAGAQPRR